MGQGGHTGVLVPGVVLQLCLVCMNCSLFPHPHPPLNSRVCKALVEELGEAHL